MQCNATCISEQKASGVVWCNAMCTRCWHVHGSNRRRPFAHANRPPALLWLLHTTRRDQEQPAALSSHSMLLRRLCLHVKPPHTTRCVAALSGNGWWLAEGMRGTWDVAQPSPSFQHTWPRGPLFPAVANPRKFTENLRKIYGKFTENFP